MQAERLRGEPVATERRAAVRERVRDLDGPPPTLATVVMSDDPDDQRFVALKHDACDAVGIRTRDARLPPEAPAARLHATVEELSDDPAVDAVFVQAPLPGHVSRTAVGSRLDPRKDVDCFHPANLGRLVAGDPRFVPATAAAVCRLLAAYGVPTEGEHAVVVGRSAAIGRPLAHRLLAADATVTVCHSRTGDLGGTVRRGDIVVTACGVPELVGGEMLAPGAVAVDVSANRRPAPDGDGVEVVGDIDHESARRRVRALTPVPGGVGPVTLAALLENVVLAAERRPAGERSGA
ncbi:MAG: bifunctional 5,10-methylenetetrahydrofolate dehydrogenase/5,10-methenyltetrahydrofolate cyclohydrolase [Halobacteriaceae archaeon]